MLLFVAIWHVFPTATNGFDELQQLDFLFGQYVYYDNFTKLAEAEKDIENRIPKV